MKAWLPTRNVRLQTLSSADDGVIVAQDEGDLSYRSVNLKMSTKSYPEIIIKKEEYLTTAGKDK